MNSCTATLLQGQEACGKPFSLNALAGSQLKMPLLGLVTAGSSCHPPDVAFRSRKHCDASPVALLGFTWACSPPPVQSVWAWANCITHWRVRLDPQLLTPS